MQKRIAPAIKNGEEGNIVQCNHQGEISHLHVRKRKLAQIVCSVLSDIGHWNSECRDVPKEHMFVWNSVEGKLDFGGTLCMATDYLFKF